MCLKRFSTRVAAVGFYLAFALSAARAAGPSIVITDLPVFGTSGDLGGLVTNANLTTNCVAAFIYIPHVSPAPGITRPSSWGWFSRPSCSGQLTPINPDGSWSVNITTSNFDKYASEVAAFLVPTNYNQACVVAQGGLSNAGLAKASAWVYAPRTNPNRRHLEFAGYGWWVKTAGNADGIIDDEFANPTGPGGNYFSDTTSNVWVDAQGSLHLQINKQYGVWECAEIFSDRSFGYGQYRFTVNTDINKLDPNVILGLFTWSDDTAYNDREIDIELGRWKYAFGSSYVENYAVAPYNAGQTVRFALPAGVTNSTHSFIWQSNNVSFQTLNGNFASPPVASNILQTWTNCPAPLPPPGGETVSIVLWLDSVSSPASNNVVEVVLPQFEFVPLGSPQPAQLGPMIPAPRSNVQITVQGQRDRRYDLFSSFDLLTWLPVETILATNNIFQFTDTNPPTPASRFYRALTEP